MYIFFESEIYPFIKQILRNMWTGRIHNNGRINRIVVRNGMTFCVQRYAILSAPVTSVSMLGKCRMVSMSTKLVDCLALHQGSIPQSSINRSIYVPSMTQLLRSKFYSITAISWHSTNEETVQTVPITYIEADGTEKTVQATIGKNLMEIAHEHNVDLEGACGGELACSTCHLVFQEDIYATLPEKLEDEIDMLDIASDLTETSRLGCQIKCRADFAGMKVRIPDDGF